MIHDEHIETMRDSVCCWSYKEDGVHSRNCFLVQLAEKDTEIERLRGDLAAMSDSVAVAAKALNDEERDNERLRLEAKQASASWVEDKRADEAKIERLCEYIKAIETWHEQGKKLFDNYSVGLGAMFGLGKWWGERPWVHKP